MRIGIVTGGAAGLGADIAIALHAAGMKVVIADIDAEAAARTAQKLDPSGNTAWGLGMDVGCEKAVQAAVDTIVAAWGAPWLLVNNASIMQACPVLDIALDSFDAVMRVNLRGTFITSQIIGRIMRAQGAGRIVNIASLAGQNGGTATGAHYAASKGGVLTLTKVFARDLAPHGVMVNAISPGPLELPSVENTVGAEKAQAIRSALPGGRLGDPGYIAAMVIMLAREDAAAMTGATVDINSGLYMR
ncbi:SDR family NAD(P)-dependent oxidoreductase [Komagataeibacter xylinus]|uniref:SDR family oxidoreductase n=1 Tax=Komagataeibacter xylinus TaxID=28448 RepID=A0A857FSI8_KOMXY|nr:SDR family oxidoreductase [Komagataeibacter xylinus]QHC37182.1 SDR family oxidoreductase [Komagataeibacter xylinus]